MFRAFKPFFITAESSVHPGSGSELGVVDLPIQRESYTDLPKIEGSGLKGSIREYIENSKKEVKIGDEVIQGEKLEEYVDLIFGPKEGNKHAGAISFTDAKLLFFPIKSLKGIFAWITCPYVLKRFKKDLFNIGIKEDFFSDSIEYNTIPSSNSNLLIDSKIILEEYTYEVKENDNTKKIAEFFANKIFMDNEKNNAVNHYWKKKFEKDLVILSDDDFKNFVKTSTEVIARTIINSETGTADNLWYEEYLPQDTILYSLTMCSPLRTLKNYSSKLAKNDPLDEAKTILNFFEKVAPKVLQIGGNQSIGKGMVSFSFLEGV
jgi:CRISPR-associated protein Cmr4